ncbi:MAG TPA: hypothetical protein VE130_16870 [Nitrososphaeraceae archaeon]|nr:hypothetical protein [Nitrososphaeraceae archaeon]
MQAQTQNCGFLNTELETPTLNVMMNVRCPAGLGCPSEEDVITTVIQPLPIHILTIFDGSAEGTPVNIIANMPYHIAFGNRVPEGLDSFIALSPECGHELAAGETATCTTILIFFVP